MITSSHIESCETVDTFPRMKTLALNILVSIDKPVLVRVNLSEEFLNTSCNSKIVHSLISLLLQEVS